MDSTNINFSFNFFWSFSFLNHGVQQSFSYNVTHLIKQHYYIEGIHEDNLIIPLLSMKY